VGAQLGVAVGLLLDGGADPVVLAGVGSDVGENAELVDVRVVLWVETFYFRMKGSVGRVADSGVSKVGPFSLSPFKYLRYILGLKGPPNETRRLIYEGFDSRSAPGNPTL
jgi:hypothetical protein